MNQVVEEVPAIIGRSAGFIALFRSHDMSPRRGAAALALSVLMVAPSAWSDDNELPTPPVPGKSLPVKDSKQADRQAELESAHRAVANEWRNTLAEVARRRPGKDPDEADWIERIKEGIREETLGAEYHARLKKRFLGLDSHPGEPIPRDLPPPSICRAQDQDRAVLEAFLKHLLDSWRAADPHPGPPRDIMLDA
jgi:hypothetical protein